MSKNFPETLAMLVPSPHTGDQQPISPHKEERRMSTKHTFTHADGTVSKRVSQNRVYPFAVEVTRNQYGYAKSLEANELASAEKRLADFDALAANPEWDVQTKSYSSFVSNNLILVGYGYVAGWYTNNSSGKPDDEEPNREQALDTARTRLVNDVHRYREQITKLREGPEFSYGIVTWSSRRDLAQKEASRLQGRASWYNGYRVVETTYTTKGA